MQRDEGSGTEDFTQEERALISRFLYERPRRFGMVSSYAMYILPSALFVAFGIWKRELLAVTLGYAALLGGAVLYLGAAETNSKLLWSILTKYERRVGALETRSRKSDGLL